jgi:amino acid transporter
MTTNIRIGAGGAYSLISQSLGIEMGGAIGLPLYLSQGLAVAMYIFGFRAGWLSIFPGHPAWMVDLGLFLVLFLIANVSAGLAFRIQYVILAVIIGSLLAVAYAAATGSMTEEVTWVVRRQVTDDGTIPATFSPHFWVVFAVFFPAATGIMAGANMSGDLENPRRSIPVGTLSAMALSLVIYLVLAWWLARSGSQENLRREDYVVLLEHPGVWKPAILGGLLGATFSSALASLVGAPRVLQALSEHEIIPHADWLAQRTPRGEPRHALWFTCIIVLGAVMLRELNAIAPLITMFFLITYGMINAVVALEQRLGLTSFRPLFPVPRWVPLLGTAGCAFAMFIINPVFGLVAVGVVLVVYMYLIRRHLQAPFGDVRSGLFVALAEWAATKVATLPENQERSWKPNMLVPVENPPVLRGSFDLLHALARPRGTVRILGLDTPGPDPWELEERLERLGRAFREEGTFASWTHMETETFSGGVVSGVEALNGSFFQPNIIFLNLPKQSQERKIKGLQAISDCAQENNFGLVIYAEHTDAQLGRRHTVNVWLPDAGPDWELTTQPGESDLELLLAYKLRRNWDASLRVIARVDNDQQRPRARAYVDGLLDLARLPHARGMVTKLEPPIKHGAAPEADLHLLWLGEQPDYGRMVTIRENLAGSCLFIRGSGHESALA